MNPDNQVVAAVPALTLADTYTSLLVVATAGQQIGIEFGVCGDEAASFRYRVRGEDPPNQISARHGPLELQVMEKQGK